MTLDTMIELLTEIRSIVGGQTEIVFHTGNGAECDRIHDVPVSRLCKVIDDSTVLCEKWADRDLGETVEMVVVS